jgi:elongation factor G
MTAQPRCVALVGPSQSGKTALFEAILRRVGAADGASPRNGHAVGDPSPEARAHGLSVEATVASVSYLGDAFAFIDCPGSVDFRHAASVVLPFCDAAVVVCEPDERKVAALQLTLRELETLGVPHLLFLNKIDAAAVSVHDALAWLQAASRAPLLLRQLPMTSEGRPGFIDLALERAFVYRDGEPARPSICPRASWSGSARSASTCWSGSPITTTG